MRGTITGIAVACYAAALVVTAAALGLPDPDPTVNIPIPATAHAPPREASAPEPTVADDIQKTPSPPTLAPAGNKPSEEETLLRHAEKTQSTGDLKMTKEIYLRLLREGNYRDLAAQRLGDLHFNAGEYRRAEELYRESARLLREERNIPAQKPLLP